VNVDELVAIDIHTHAEVSTRMLPDEAAQELDEAKGRYFKYVPQHPTIAQMPRTTASGRWASSSSRSTTSAAWDEAHLERGGRRERGGAPRRRDPVREHRSGARQARRARGAAADRALRRQGIQVPPLGAGLLPNDHDAYPLYEVIAEAKLPALFHTGQTGSAPACRARGIRLKYANPLYLDDVAVDFPDMPIVMAHPSVPWQDERCRWPPQAAGLHRPVGLVSEVLPPQLVQYANTLLKHKVLFAPTTAARPDRWIADFGKLDIKPEVRPLIMKENAVRLLRLGAHRSRA